ncbi:MAG: hypothetical protein MZW92_08460 [Comamonadaceae bacterium]|nr:hypothetical protein [Comamonadaceae bacterium]
MPARVRRTRGSWRRLSFADRPRPSTAGTPQAWKQPDDAHFGTEIVLLAEQLAGHSDDPTALTVAYLTRAHQTAGAEIAGWMIAAGMQVRIDAVGNVIGRYAARPTRRRRC